MSNCCKKLFSSLSKKYLMAITGLMLCGFLIVHLIGNFLILGGDQLFNSYSNALITNPLIIPAEIVLSLIFLTHLLLAIIVTIENKKARPEDYYYKKLSGNGATIFSRTMPLSGLIILVFLIIHLLNFKYGNVYYQVYDGVKVRDLYKLVMEHLSSPLNAIWYIFANVCVGFHLSHGFWSAFQSLGIHLSSKKFSYIFAWLISSGYIFIVIYCYFRGRGL